MRNEHTSQSTQKVVRCYSVLDKFFPSCGLLDFSEGIYHDDPRTSYEQAQQNQISYLLDEVKCTGGARILDLGCGNGTLLEEVRRRGGVGVGITISPEQVGFCKKRGLDARLLDYREMGEEWDGYFDAVVANGSIEHFVSPRQAAAHKADEAYIHLFRTLHRIINPQSGSKGVVSTTIHFLRRPDPADLLKSPLAFRWGSDNFRYALLERSFGGFYPEIGQLERCAREYFDLVHTVDGTYDYYLTSEEWLRRIRKALRSSKGLRILAKSLPLAARHPRQFAAMVLCMLVTESWNWQFRPPDPPTRLLRQTWAYHG